MARNGSGTYNRAVAPYTAGTIITAATVNSEMDDIATALTQSLSRDGQSPPTANIPMGGFRLTGLGNAIASTDAAALGQITAAQAGAVAKAGDTMTGALNFAPWVDLASAGTTDIGAATSNNVRITGTTTITSFGTAASGVTRQLRFAAALTLTYNATSLILPGAANIITMAGDTATAVSLGSGNWVVTAFQRAASLGINRGTEELTQSVSQIDFTGIPAGVRRITLMFNNVSAGTGDYLIQLGDSGGIETTGYLGSSILTASSQPVAGSNHSTGFFIGNSNSSNTWVGAITFVAFNAPTWIASGIVGLSAGPAGVATVQIAGWKNLSGTLDRIRLSTATGTFDNGSINIMWEF